MKPTLRLRAGALLLSAVAACTVADGENGQPAEATCPEQMPELLTPCPEVGLSCSYQQTDPCGHQLDPHAWCEQDGWNGGFNAVMCPCAAVPPVAGSACDPQTEDQICSYTDPQCGQTTASCDPASSTWMVQSSCDPG